MAKIKFQAGDIVEWHIRASDAFEALLNSPAVQVAQAVIKSIDGEYARIEVIDPRTLKPVLYTVLTEQLKHR